MNTKEISDLFARLEAETRARWATTTGPAADVFYEFACIFEAIAYDFDRRAALEKVEELRKTQDRSF